MDIFTKETFSKYDTINLIQHGEYTIALEIEKKLTSCYIFRGSSYLALKKIKIIAKLITEELKTPENQNYQLVNPNQIKIIDNIIKKNIKDISK